MVKSIEEVLTLSELDELRHLEAVLGNLDKARILEQALHIECSVKTGALQVVLYHSLNNPYQFALRRVQKQSPSTDRDHLDKNQTSVEFSAARQRILHAELSLRTRDIELHKFFLSQRMRYDVGLIVASAHWLKDISPDFYHLCKTRSPQYAIGFEWLGMEKALIVQVPHQEGQYSHCVLVLKNDLMLEENLAQGTTIVREPTTTKKYARAQDARAKLFRMYTTEHVCILGK